ncbi:MAG: asparagine synthase (glutamine-hydrolyzing) [Firmicutes bacterium HGW-Firmicutes-7]|nr:MAG: asparagine synthase (glutamine-hydrolyzing) [Firmicutes bacterium HGW-Firmicutes-7]
MCGITGIINYHDNLIQEIETIHPMTDALIHRGPDAFGYYYNEKVLLGHRRLIVIDPTGGIQPMTYKKEIYEYTLVYNGELYNTDEVRKLLIQKGYDFSSHCDTEVVLKAYVEWGEDSLQYLNGIYAFAIWENRTKTLFLARDRIGVKPLFYTQVNGYFIFASEIKALLEHPLVEPVFNETSLLELFSLGPSRVNGSGLFKNIYEVKPAEFIYLTEKKCVKKIYWRPITGEHTENKSSTIERISFLVEDAIKSQLISDVPICTFLSGGLDSSAISSIASKYLFENKGDFLTTYSVDYEENDLYFAGDTFQPSNDNMWVSRVSKYINSNHHRIELGIDELANALWDATRANDYPGMADIDSSLLLFCNKVKKKHTVALSGECADEIFGGYPWYRNFTDIHYDGFPWIKHMDVRKSFLSEGLAKLKINEFANSEYKKSIQEIEYLDHEDSYDRGIRRLTYLNYKWFMVTLLTRKDRMSMYNGLEVRVPYADHRIIEYAYNIPWSIKYMDNIEKGLLRAALKEHLPSEVISRKKSPYPKTYHPKYNTLLCQLLKSILDKPHAPIKGLININKVNNLLNNDLNAFQTPWFGQLMKGPQFVAYLIQLNYFLEMHCVDIEGL